MNSTSLKIAGDIRKNLFLVSPLFLLAVLQDLLRSVVRDHPFYWSESLLFATFWLLFFPAALLFPAGYVRRAAAVPLVRIGGSFARIFSFTFLHLLFFAALVWLVSDLFLAHTFTLVQMMRYGLSELVYFALIGYSALEIAALGKRSSGASDQAKARLRPSSRLTSLTLHRNGTLHFVAADEILFARTNSPYVEISTAEQKFLETTSLRTLEHQLDPVQFVRIHRSCIINLGYIIRQKSRGNGDYDLEMKDGTALRLSRNYVAEFNKRLAAHQLSLR